MSIHQPLKPFHVMYIRYPQLIRLVDKLWINRQIMGISDRSSFAVIHRKIRNGDNLSTGFGDNFFAYPLPPKIVDNLSTENGDKLSVPLSMWIMWIT